MIQTTVKATQAWKGSIHLDYREQTKQLEKTIRQIDTQKINKKNNGSEGIDTQTCVVTHIASTKTIQN